MACSALSTTDWIRIAAASATLLGVATAWLLPLAKRRLTERWRLSGVVRLYLGVFERKLDRERALIRERRGDVASGKFEEYNRCNFEAIEKTLIVAGGVLRKREYAALYALVESFKTSDNMKTEKDIDSALEKFRAAQRVFPPEDGRVSRR